MPTVDLGKLDALRADADDLSMNALSSGLNNNFAKADNARAAYYQFLSNYGINYGTLAAGVMLDDTVPGILANGFLNLRALKNYQLKVTYSIQKEISTNLMDLDGNARDAKGGQDLSYEQIRDYHQFAFNRVGTGIDCWTAYDPVEVLGPSLWPTLANGGLLADAGVFSAMYQIWTGNALWATPTNSDVERAYAWCRDVTAVCEARAGDIAASLKNQAAGGASQIGKFFHIGGVTDSGTIQLAAGDVGVAGQAATIIIGSGSGSYTYLGGGAANIAETAGGDIIDTGTANEDGQAGDELVKITQENPAQGTCMVFGKNCGHVVIESPVADDKALAAAIQAGNFSDADVPDSLENLHIVLAGLNKEDVTFFYKQQDYYGYVTGADGFYSWDRGLATSARYAGYIKINSTGETLVLPDEAGDRQMQEYAGREYSTRTGDKPFLKVPDSFSVRFAESSNLR